MDQLFKYIVDYFTEDWLNKKKEHPIKQLWQRSDELSTNELFSLAIGIEAFWNLDRKWVREQLQYIKGTDKNNRQGAAFEILGLNMLNHTKHPVTPTKRNLAGYDGTMQISASKEIRLSLKNYGSSAHQVQFEKMATATENTIKNLLKKYSYGPVSIIIDCPIDYPTQTKWDLLHAYIDDCFKTKRNDTDPFFAIATDKPEWIILINPLTENDGAKYHSGYNSYSLIVTAPYHKNEKDNLISKIEDACHNLTKHSSIENDNICNILFLHLSPNASINYCKQWVEEYFLEFPNKPITGVFLYQPSVASLEATNSSTAIVHFFLSVLKEQKYIAWIPPGFTIDLVVPVGIASTEPTQNKLIIQYPNKPYEQILLNDRYTYQHGSHYLKMQEIGAGSWQGTMHKVGSGVYTSVVMEFPGQPNQAVLSPKVPPFDELLIL